MIIKNNTELKVDFLIDDETHEIFVRFKGFKNDDELNDYCEFLSSYLPLMLFQSTIIH